MELMKIKEASGKAIKSALDVSRLCSDIALADREVFVVLHLNARNKVIEKEIVSMGILDSCLIHPREVFKKAIIKSAHSIITVHNHPGGSLTPSIEDLDAWKKLIDAGDLLGISVLDHIIVTSQGYYSQKEEV